MAKKVRNTHGFERDGVEYEPGHGKPSDLPALEPEGYSFSLMELRVLEEYAKTRDLPQACATAGYMNPHASAAAMREKEKFKVEMALIHDAWRLNTRMTAEHASGHFLQTMEEFFKDYRAGDEKLKGALANSLARMNSDYLRATGYFDREGGNTESQVTINFNLSDEGSEVEVDSTGSKAKARVGRKKGGEG